MNVWLRNWTPSGRRWGRSEQRLRAVRTDDGCPRAGVDRRAVRATNPEQTRGPHPPRGGPTSRCPAPSPRPWSVPAWPFRPSCAPWPVDGSPVGTAPGSGPRSISRRPPSMRTARSRGAGQVRRSRRHIPNSDRRRSSGSNRRSARTGVVHIVLPWAPARCCFRPAVLSIVWRPGPLYHSLHSRWRNEASALRRARP
jgi:hypothetical protein